MNQALLSGIASKAYDKLLKAAESKQPIAVTGLPDTMAAYIASKLCADTGKKVLLISGNDLKAVHDAETASSCWKRVWRVCRAAKLTLRAARRATKAHGGGWKRWQGRRRGISACSVRVWTPPCSAWAAPTASAKRRFALLPATEST